MSVSVDKFLAYKIDITEEYFSTKNTREKDWDKLLYSRDTNEIPEALRKLGFKLDCENPNTGDIALIVDGFNGLYAWILYIESAEYRIYDHEELPSSINNCLKNVPIPEDVREKLTKAYELICLKPLTSEIRLEHLKHFY